jgi:quinol monooxygenase YgiN
MTEAQRHTTVRARTATVTRLVAQAGQRTRLVECLQPFLANADAEPDTISYAMHLDDNDDDAVWFYVVFASEKGRRVHAANEAALGPETERLAGTLREPSSIFSGTVWATSSPARPANERGC